MHTYSSSRPALLRGRTRVRRQETTRGRGTHLQVYTELGVGRGGAEIVSEHARCAGMITCACAFLVNTLEVLITFPHVTITEQKVLVSWCLWSFVSVVSDVSLVSAEN